MSPALRELSYHVDWLMYFISADIKKQLSTQTHREL